MKKKSDKFDSKRNNKVPIFKADLEFEIFHANNLQQIDRNKLNFRKEYFNKVSKELANSKENNKVKLLKKIIFDNNNESLRLEGLNQLDRQENIV